MILLLILSGVAFTLSIMAGLRHDRRRLRESVERFHRRSSPTTTCDCGQAVFRRLEKYTDGSAKLRCYDCGHILLTPPGATGHKLSAKS